MLNMYLVHKVEVNNLMCLDIYEKDLEELVGEWKVDGVVYDYINNIVIYDYNKKEFDTISINITAIFPKKSITQLHKKFLRNRVSNLLLSDNAAFYLDDIANIVNKLDELYYNKKD